MRSGFVFKLNEFVSKTAKISNPDQYLDRMRGFVRSNWQADLEELNPKSTQAAAAAFAFSIGEAENMKRLQVSRSTPFSNEELTELKLFAQINQSSVQLLELKSARSYQERVIDLVAKVATKLAGVTQLDALGKVVCQQIRSELNYYYVALFLIDDDGKELEFLASSISETAESSALEWPHPHVPLGKFIIGTVGERGKPILANDVSKEPLYGSYSVLKETQAELAIPLKIGKRVIGVLDIESNEIGAFSRSDLQILTALADNLALAVNRVRLFSTLARRDEQLDLIGRIGKSLVDILDQDELLHSIARAIHEEFGYPFVHIFLVEHAPLRIQYKAGSGGRADAYDELKLTLALDSNKGIIAEAIRQKQVQLVNDISEAPLYLPSPIDEEFSGSELVIPLLFANNAIGVLDIQSDKKNAFTDNDVELLTTIAANISVAVRNASLYNSEQWRRKVAESLRDIALTLAKNIPLDETLEKVLSKIMSVVPCELALVALFDGDYQIGNETSPELKIFSCIRGNGETDCKGKSFASQDAWFMEGFEILHPVIYSGKDPDELMTLVHLPVNASAISAPLTVGEKPVGVLLLYHSEPMRFGQETTRLCSTWSGYIGSAIENNQLEQANEEQNWLSTILLQVALSTQGLTEVNELTTVMGQLMMILIGGRAGGIITFDLQSKTYELRSVYGRGVHSNDLPLPLRHTNILDTLTREADLRAVPASVFEPAFQSSFSLRQNQTVLLIPLISNEEVLGFLVHIGDDDYIDQAPESVLGRQTTSIMKGIAQQTAIALQNINLLDRAEENSYISSVLMQISRLLAYTNSLHDGLKSSCEALIDLGGFMAVALFEYLPDEKAYTLNYSAAAEQKELDVKIGFKFPEDQLPPQQLFANLRVKEVGHSNKLHLRAAIKKQNKVSSDLSDQSWLTMPLMAQNEKYGFMAVLDPHPKGRNERSTLVQGVGQQISSAIQNAYFHHVQHQQSMVERELQLARQIQKNFLPGSVPEIDGFDLAVSWETARQVGGDFYDIFRIDEQHWGLVIADVSDKGLPAALYMTVARTLIKSVGISKLDPAETMETVNHLLQMTAKEGFFITTFYGVLDTSSATLRYCLAGHNPPVIVAEDGKITALPKGGIALGIFDPASFTTKQLDFHPGDALLCYTDGITEEMNASGEQYGLSRLMQTLTKLKGKKPEDSISYLLDDLDAYRGTESISDDRTVMYLQRKLY